MRRHENRDVPGLAWPPAARQGRQPEPACPKRIPDGITERSVKGAGRFGVDGMHRAIQTASAPTAAATAMAIQDAVMSSATDPLQDERAAGADGVEASSSLGGTTQT